MVHLPALMLSARILWLVISLIVGNDEIRNTLHQGQKELAGGLDIVWSGFRPLAEVPHIVSECLDGE